MPAGLSIEANSEEESSMFYALMGYLHAAAVERVRAIRALAESERGQGTVESVGLILLVSLLMVGMVAAMKGFNKSHTRGATSIGASAGPALISNQRPLACEAAGGGLPSFV
jgi:hypothetical protein